MLSGKTLGRNLLKVDTNKELAKVAGLSYDTIKGVKTIEQKASEETKEKLRTQEISINQA